MSGNGGCNDYTAPYTLVGQKLTIGPNIASTKKACQGPAQAIETVYLAGLTTVGSYYITGTTLTLSTADLKPILIW